MLILVVSHHQESLNRKISAFQRAGNIVLPASSSKNCLSMIAHNSCDLLVIGATVPLTERREVVAASKGPHPETNIISVERQNSQSLVPTDCVVEAGDELQLLNRISMFRQQLG